MKGKLLSAEDWHYLLQMRNLEDFLKYLSGTDYAPVLARLSGVTPPVGELSLALIRRSFQPHGQAVESCPQEQLTVLGKPVAAL